MSMLQSRIGVGNKRHCLIVDFVSLVIKGHVCFISQTATESEGESDHYSTIPAETQVCITVYIVQLTSVILTGVSMTVTVSQTDVNKKPDNGSQTAANTEPDNMLHYLAVIKKSKSVSQTDVNRKPDNGSQTAANTEPDNVLHYLAVNKKLKSVSQTDMNKRLKM